MTEVIRDANGVVINIGPWDYQVEVVDTGLIGEDGAPLFREIINNPLPEGAYKSEAKVKRLADGGLSVCDDDR